VLATLAAAGLVLLSELVAVLATLPTEPVTEPVAVAAAALAAPAVLATLLVAGVAAPAALVTAPVTVPAALVVAVLAAVVVLLTALAAPVAELVATPTALVTVPVTVDRTEDGPEPGRMVAALAGAAVSRPMPARMHRPPNAAPTVYKSTFRAGLHQPFMSATVITQNANVHTRHAIFARFSYGGRIIYTARWHIMRTGIIGK
jgi:hypothetical protein